MEWIIGSVGIGAILLLMLIPMEWLDVKLWNKK
jgi:hypothetical protein